VTNKDKWFATCMVLMLVTGFGLVGLGLDSTLASIFEVAAAAIWLFGVPKVSRRAHQYIYGR
jgi:hypothetical protein